MATTPAEAPSKSELAPYSITSQQCTYCHAFPSDLGKSILVYVLHVSLSGNPRLTEAYTSHFPVYFELGWTFVLYLFRPDVR